MAVFLVNSCKFNGCGLTFGTLSTLIQHIEETHLDTDPEIVQQLETEQPPSLSPSYVFRIFTEGSCKEKRHRLASLSPVSSLRSTTPTGSEFDEEDARSSEEDSDDSWTTQEEFTSELILSMMTNSHTKDSNADKPFACPVPGCKKRYKNINGIKYHAKHGHKKEVRVRKPYKCQCGKSYRTTTALQSHSVLQHQGALPSLMSVKGRPPMKPRLRVTTPAPKTKAGGLIGKLPVAALASQAQARKQLQASLKTLASSISGIVPQGGVTSASQGTTNRSTINPPLPPASTTLVTVPVTFGKLPTITDKQSPMPQQQHQPMLNLIAPSGLVPPGTTITVPVDQIARNLALLQQVPKSTRAPAASGLVPRNEGEGSAITLATSDKTPTMTSTPKAPPAASGVTASTRLIQTFPEMSVPSCMLSEERAVPYSFAENSFEDSAIVEDMDVDICLDKLRDPDEQLSVLSLDSGTFSQPSKEQELAEGIIDDDSCLGDGLGARDAAVMDIHVST